MQLYLRRYWRWDRGSEGGPKKDRCHIVDQGDTLAKISRLYNVAVSDIIKWNGISGASRKISLGMKLIVVKGDPDKPTAAEENAEKQKQIAKDKARRIMVLAGVRDPEKEREEMIKKREMRDIQAIRREMDKGTMNNRMQKAVMQRDEEFVFSGLLSDEDALYDAQMFSLGHRITGKAPKPHAERKIAASTGDAVESQVEAIYTEGYVPDEELLSGQVKFCLLSRESVV